MFVNGVVSELILASFTPILYRLLIRCFPLFNSFSSALEAFTRRISPRVVVESPEKRANSSWRCQPIRPAIFMIGMTARKTTGTAIKIIAVIFQSIIIMITRAPKNCSMEVSEFGIVFAKNTQD